MNTPDTTKEVIALAEKIKARLELDEETDEIAARIYAAMSAPPGWPMTSTPPGPAV